MSKVLWKTYVIKSIQFLIYFISLTMALFYKSGDSNWHFYLLILGVLIGLFIPVKYRPNFSSTDASIYFKNRSRKLESIIEMVVIIIIFCIETYLSIY